MEKINFILKNKAYHKPFLVDYHQPTEKNAPVLIFLHGFKGFKDFGAFDEWAKYWTQKGYIVFKMNFSHNGTNPDCPLSFVDLESFGHNNLSKELSDVNVLVDYITDADSELPSRNSNQITLVGHSRGGSTALIYASQDKRITKVISLAALANLERRYFSEQNQNLWQEHGVVKIINGRTKQEMPLYPSFYEDFVARPKNYEVEKAVRSLLIPQLIIHGDTDTAVHQDNADEIYSWNPKATLKLIKKADHTFLTKHPQVEPLSKPCYEMLDVVASF